MIERTCRDAASYRGLEYHPVNTYPDSRALRCEKARVLSGANMGTRPRRIERRLPGDPFTEHQTTTLTWRTGYCSCSLPSVCACMRRKMQNTLYSCKYGSMIEVRGSIDRDRTPHTDRATADCPQCDVHISGWPRWVCGWVGGCAWVGV